MGIGVGFFVVGSIVGSPTGHTFTNAHFSSGKTPMQHSWAESYRKNSRRAGSLHDCGKSRSFVQVRFAAADACHGSSHAASGFASGGAPVGRNVGQGYDVGHAVDGISVNGAVPSAQASRCGHAGVPKWVAQHAAAVAKRKWARMAGWSHATG